MASSIASLKGRPRREPLSWRQPCWPIRRTLWVSTMALASMTTKPKTPTIQFEAKPTSRTTRPTRKPSAAHLQLRARYFGRVVEPIRRGRLGIVGVEALLDLVQDALFVLVKRHVSPP